jgi:hypothetical protein
VRSNRIEPSTSACTGFAGPIGRGDALEVESILNKQSAGEISKQKAG